MCHYDPLLAGLSVETVGLMTECEAMEALEQTWGGASDTPLQRPLLGSAKATLLRLVDEQGEIIAIAVESFV